jgi:AraC-like DNA-binding protein
MPITKIAAMVGYQSLTNFGEFFRKQTGRSPGAFRKASSSQQAARAVN